LYYKNITDRMDEFIMNLVVFVVIFTI